MINKCLFPAAGYGTRFLPATKAVPKEMLPVLNKPLLQYGVEEALAAGIHNMAIVTGRGKRSIEDHFDNSFELESQLRGTPKEKYLDEINSLISQSTFTYVRQNEMLGLGHAILTGEPLIGKESFAVLLADDLCIWKDFNLLSEMIKIHEKYKTSVIAIEEVSVTEIEKYGIISGDLIDESTDTYIVQNMLEKPNLNDLEKKMNYENFKSYDKSKYMGIIGRYILTPDIFDKLKRIQSINGNEIQITDALQIQANEGKVIAYKYQGNRFDCGSVEGFVEATNYLAKKL